MLILKYFLTVGTALTIGLFLLSSYLESGKPVSAPRVVTTATLAVPAPPAPKPAVAAASYEEQLPPPAESRGRGRHRR